MSDMIQRMGFFSRPQRPYYTTPDDAGVPRDVDYLRHDLDRIAASFRPATRSARAPSLMSSDASSIAESVFDSSATSSLYVPSTAPSRRSHLPLHLADWIAAQNRTGGEYVLPCEFAGYASCTINFDPSETDQWIEHIISVHLHDKLPQKCICWFCDEMKFSAKDWKVDPRTNFENRMAHIREHIFFDRKNVHDIRPDFHFLEHLRKHHLITEEMYGQARSWDERPQVPSYVHASTFESPARVREAERRNQVPHDQRKEDRRNRKQHQQGQCW